MSQRTHSIGSVTTSLLSKWAAGPAAAGREEGAFLNRYVTDEQRSRRPIFNATLRAAASWLFFLRRGGSTPYESDMGASLAP